MFSDDDNNNTIRTVVAEVLARLIALLEDLGRRQNITFTVTGMLRFGEFIKMFGTSLPYLEVYLLSLVYL